MPHLFSPLSLRFLATPLLLFAAQFPSLTQTLPDYLPTDGLAAWWNMDGNSVDASGNGNHGSLVGTVPFANRHGQAGEALFFNGSGDHILVPLSPSLAISGSFSASVWVNLQGGSCNPRVFELHEVLNCGGYTLAFEGSGGGSRGFHAMSFGTCEAGMSAATGGLSIPTNSWHHVGVTFEVGDVSVSRLYIDGALVSTNSVNRNIGGSDYYGAALCIGNIAPYRCDWFGGGMDELGFWNRALTDSEVMALYLGEAAAPGCTDATACNFNAEANTDDGSCLMPGCTDVGACNFDPTTTCSGACNYDCNCISFEWVQSGPTAPISGLTEAINGGFIVKTENEVYHVPILTGAWVSLGFDAQTSFSGGIGQLVGYNSQGELFTSTSWDCFYKRTTAGTWVNMGMCGFGTGGQWWTEGDNGRILMTKGGFLRNVYKSDDQGTSWQALGTGNVDWHHLFRAANGDFFASAPSGILKITDNGNAHSVINYSFPVTVSSGDCVHGTSNAVYAGVNSNQIYKSVDWGNTWTIAASAPAEYSIALFRFVSEHDAIVQLKMNGLTRLFHLNTPTGVWTDIHGGLPAFASEHWITPYVFNGTVLLATVSGLYFSNGCLIQGCTDPTACNFNPEANADDGSCVPSGCTDAAACNFDADAGCDDGSCAPADAVVGCMELGACNFNAAAVCAGTCVYPAAGLADCAAGGELCGEGMVWDVAAQTCTIDPDFIAGAIEVAVAEALMGCVPVYPGGPGSSGCPGDLSGDGFIGTNDLLELLSVYSMMCPEPPQGTPCAGLESVSYQGEVYPVVAVGGECWFGANLRVRNYANGDAIPGGLSDAAWVAATAGAQAVSGGDPERLEAYGRLYNWFAVNDPRGLCPAGWHVPSNVEWMDFEVALGMDPVGVFTTGWRGEDEGTQLKADPTDWVPWNGTDEFGFSAVPGGYRSYMGGGPSFDAGTRGYYWTSSASISGRAWSRGFSTEQSGISRDYSYHQLGFSVRCIKD